MYISGIHYADRARRLVVAVDFLKCSVRKMRRVRVPPFVVPSVSPGKHIHYT